MTKQRKYIIVQSSNLEHLKSMIKRMSEEGYVSHGQMFIKDISEIGVHFYCQVMVVEEEEDSF